MYLQTMLEHIPLSTEALPMPFAVNDRTVVFSGRATFTVLSMNLPAMTSEVVLVAERFNLAIFFLTAVASFFVDARRLRSAR